MRPIVSVLFAAVVCFAVVPALADDHRVSVSSPDGRNTIAVAFEDGGLVCTVTRDGRAFLAGAPISVTIDGEAFPGEPAVVSTDESSVDRRVTVPVPTVASTLRDRYNEAFVGFEGGVGVRLRAYDEGVAYRWELDRAGETLTVNSETLGVAIEPSTEAWVPVATEDGFWSHQEWSFDKGPFGEKLGESPVAAPVLFELGGGGYAVLTDVGNHAYPGLWLASDAEHGPHAVFPPYPLSESVTSMRDTRVGEAADFIARVPGEGVLPWRAVAFDDAAGLLTNSLFYLLAEPSRIADPSWIEPGLVAWDWWNALNIGGVDFEAGVNQATYMHYIDFAAENKLPYVILDEGWSRPDPDGLLDVVPEIDMPELVRYAEDRGVGVILWMTSTMLERSFDEAFPVFERWGIKGLKIDFMQRDDQKMMELCYRFAEAAARSRLLVNLHGGSKPQGITRTYPNVLTLESVLGLEQSKWSDRANPEYATLLPFTRMIVGAMDYTPGAMHNLVNGEFRSMFSRPASMGTRAHQLAMYTVFVSPLQMLADTPTHYRRFPRSLAWIASMPVTWDETVPLIAEIGDVVAVARRHGKGWYVGVLNDWDEREVELDLSFLGSGRYDAKLATDGVNAHRFGEDVSFGERRVDASTTLSVRLAPGGGAAMIITPAAGG